MLSMSLAELARLEEARQALGVSEVAGHSEEIAGGWMCFDGPGSWANQACALGLAGPVADSDLDRLVAYYESRGAEPMIGLAPFVDQTLVDGLARRGFAVSGFENVLMRPIDLVEELDAPLAGFRIVEVDPADADQVRAFVEVSTSGFRPLDQPISGSLFELTRRVVEHPRCTSYLVLVDGQPAGGGIVEVLPPLCALYGTSVLPDFRRRGIQAALIRRRLEHGRAAGCAVSTIQSRPGLPTERNALRAGFSVAYTRVNLVKRATGAADRV